MNWKWCHHHTGNMGILWYLGRSCCRSHLYHSAQISECLVMQICHFQCILEVTLPHCQWWQRRVSFAADKLACQPASQLINAWRRDPWVWDPLPLVGAWQSYTTIEYTTIEYTTILHHNRRHTFLWEEHVYIYRHSVIIMTIPKGQGWAICGM